MQHLLSKISKAPVAILLISKEVCSCWVRMGWSFICAIYAQRDKCWHYPSCGFIKELWLTLHETWMCRVLELHFKCTQVLLTNLICISKLNFKPSHLSHLSFMHMIVYFYWEANLFCEKYWIYKNIYLKERKNCENAIKVKRRKMMESHNKIWATVTKTDLKLEKS